MNINIQATNFTADQKLQDLVMDKLKKCYRFFDNIIQIDVRLKLDAHSNHIKNKVVDISVQVPGKIIRAASTRRKFEDGIGETLPTIIRNLKKYKERTRA